MTNIEYPLGPAGQPYLVFMMNALCRAEHKNLMGNLRFRARTRECWQQYSYIKWFHEEYPKIPITILTKTVGHFDELATADPYREAEIIKNSWWGFHHLPANIVIYHLNYFTMPGLDQRREDVADENFLRYLKIPGTNQDIRDVNDIPVTLVGPDGRILATMPYHWNAVKKTKEIVDPFYTWYQQKSRSTFDRLSDAKHESDENRHSGVR